MTYNLKTCFSNTLIVAIVLLAGCSSPKIKLHTLPSPEKSSPFQGTLALAPASWVTVGIPPTDPKDGSFKKSTVTDKNKNQLKTLVTPSLSGWMFGVEPRDKWYATTKMSYTYWDNSYQFKTLGFAFEDNAIKYIQGAGGILIAAATLAAPPAPIFYTSSTPGEDAKGKTKDRNDSTPRDLATPIIFTLDDDKTWVPTISKKGLTYPATTQQKINTNFNWWYRIEIAEGLNEARSLGATDICTVFNQAPNCEISTIKSKEVSSAWLTSMPIPRCVNVNLVIGGDNLSPAAILPIRISDPRYVDMVPIPEKGTITMHTVCGADLAIESGSSEGTRSIATIQAMLNEIQKLKTVQDAE